MRPSMKPNSKQSCIVNLYLSTAQFNLIILFLGFSPSLLKLRYITPMNDLTPEDYARRLLQSNLKHARRTRESRLEVSRVDATCWYLSQVFVASAKEVKRFLTAFKGKMHTYSQGRMDQNGQWLIKTWAGLEPAYALLNISYGGVGKDFLGTLLVRRHQSHYGQFAPLFRPRPQHYAPTIDGFRRAERVNSLLEGLSHLRRNG